MLGGDEREQRQLERVGLALQQAESIAADVRVLRGEDDVAAVGQVGAESVVRGLDRPVDDHLRGALQAVLADDHRPPLAGLDVLGQQQDAVGEHVRIDVENHLVARPLVVVHDPARARVEVVAGRRATADDLVPQVVAVVLAGFLPLLERGRVGLRPELAAALARFADELLGVVDRAGGTGGPGERRDRRTAPGNSARTGTERA